LKAEIILKSEEKASFEKLDKTIDSEDIALKRKQNNR